MKKSKKTYGVYDLVEWHAIIPFGKAHVKATFAGGSVTTNGIIPAKFTTENPVIQIAIERSLDYLNGRIKLLTVVETEEDINVYRNGVNRAKVETEEAKAVLKAKMKAEDESGGDITVIDVTCNNDAAAYMQEHFGVTTREMLNRAMIADVAKKHGIEFNFIKQ